jgi:hypothetical protein
MTIIRTPTTTSAAGRTQRRRFLGISAIAAMHPAGRVSRRSILAPPQPVVKVMIGVIGHTAPGATDHVLPALRPGPQQQHVNQHTQVGHVDPRSCPASARARTRHARLAAVPSGSQPSVMGQGAMTPVRPEPPPSLVGSSGVRPAKWRYSHSGRGMRSIRVRVCVRRCNHDGRLDGFHGQIRASHAYSKPCSTAIYLGIRTPSRFLLHAFNSTPRSPDPACLMRLLPAALVVPSNFTRDNHAMMPLLGG